MDVQMSAEALTGSDGSIPRFWSSVFSIVMHYDALCGRSLSRGSRRCLKGNARRSRRATSSYAIIPVGGMHEVFFPRNFRSRGRDARFPGSVRLGSRRRGKPISREVSSTTVSGWRVAQSGDRNSAPRSGRTRSKSADAEKVWRSEDLDILGIGMGVGDLDGDGNNEIVIISPNSVYVYRLTQGRLDLVTEYSAGSLELKSVDVAKIRKQGPCRIYITAQNRGTVSSFVMELRSRVLEPVIQDVRYYLRVIDYPTHGPILLGQRKGMSRTYEGPYFA